MYLLSALHGHGTSCAPVGERQPDRVQAGHEVAVVPERVERGLAHPGHDPHRGGDVGRVGQLHADVGDRRADRAHRERHHVHRAAAHRALEQVASASRASRRARASCWSGRRRPRVGEQMNVRSSTRATSRGVRQREVGVRGAWPPTAARTCRPRSASARAGRTPRPSRRTSGRRRAASARRPRLPTPAGECGWCCLVLRCGMGHWVQGLLTSGWAIKRIRIRSNLNS